MKLLLRVLIGILTVLLFTSVAFAAIGPYAYPKYPYTTLFLLDEGAPVALSSADIVFDYSGPPARNDVDRIYLDGKVISTYQVENTSDIEQTATMAFAFFDRENALEDSVSVQVDGTEVAYVPYISTIKMWENIDTGELVTIDNTVLDKDSPYDYPAIADMIRNGGVYTPKTYSLDEEGVLYNFDVETPLDLLNFYIGLNYDPDKTKVIFDDNFNAGREWPDGYRRSMSIDKNTRNPGRYCSLFVLGEQYDLQISADTGYPDYIETDAYTYKVTQKKYSLEEYLNETLNMKAYSDIGKTRLLQCLDEIFIENDGDASQFDISGYYSYERPLAAGFSVVLPPNSSKVIKIQHNTYTSMNRIITLDEDSPVFTEKILFNAPDNWQSTGKYDFTIIPHEKAPFIVASNFKVERTNDNTYRASFDTMPTGSLTFSMHAQMFVMTWRKLWIIVILVVAALVLLRVFRKPLANHLKSIKHR